MARLILQTAEGQQAIDLRPVNSLGRHPNNFPIQLLDKIVSKEHCIIELRADRWFLRDLGSLNGTFVNNERVRGEAPLKHGDEIAPRGDEGALRRRRRRAAGVSPVAGGLGEPGRPGRDAPGQPAVADGGSRSTSSSAPPRSSRPPGLGPAALRGPGAGVSVQAGGLGRALHAGPAADPPAWRAAGAAAAVRLSPAVRVGWARRRPCLRSWQGPGGPGCARHGGACWPAWSTAGVHPAAADAYSGDELIMESLGDWGGRVRVDFRFQISDFRDGTEWADGTDGPG